MGVLLETAGFERGAQRFPTLTAERVDGPGNVMPQSSGKVRVAFREDAEHEDSAWRNRSRRGLEKSAKPSARYHGVLMAAQ